MTFTYHTSKSRVNRPSDLTGRVVEDRLEKNAAAQNRISLRFLQKYCGALCSDLWPSEILNKKKKKKCRPRNKRPRQSA